MQNAKTGRVETRLTWSTGHPDSFSPPLSAFVWRSPVFLVLCFAFVSLLSLSSVLFSFFFSFTMTKGWKKKTPLIPCYLRCSFFSLSLLFSFCLVLPASLLFLFCLFFPVQWRFSSSASSLFAAEFPVSSPPLLLFSSLFFRPFFRSVEEAYI